MSSIDWLEHLIYERIFKFILLYMCCSVDKLIDMI